MTIITPPLHPPMMSGESPLFYLKRLAHINRYESHCWLFRNQIKLRNITLGHLASQLKTYVWCELDKAGNRARHICSLDSKYLIKSIRFCPLCLKGDGIWQASWHLKTSVCCLRHKVWLIDSCYKCKKILTSTDDTYEKCSCGAKRCEMPTESIINNIFELQEFIDIGEVNTENKEQLMPIQHDLTFDKRLDLVNLFSRFAPVYKIKKAGVNTNLNKLDTAKEVLTDVTLGLLGGKSGFKAFQVMLKNMGHTQGKKVDRFTHFYREFYSKCSEPCFEDFKKIIESEINSHFTYTTKRNSLFSEETINGNLWIPALVAAKEFRIGASILRLAAREGLIDIHRKNRGKRTFLLFYRPHIEARIYYLREQLNATQASILLGVTKLQLNILCENNEFVSAIPPKLGLCTSWRVSRSEINDYLTKITENTCPFYSEGILIHEAIKRHENDIPNFFIEMMYAIKSGSLNARVKMDKFGLRGFEVCSSRLNCLIVQITPFSYHSATQMSKKMNMEPELMIQLVKQKLIKSHMGNSSQERTIPIKFARQFMLRFVFGYRLSAVLGFSTIQLYKYLAEQGIKPINDEKTLNLTAKMYYRHDLWDVPLIEEYVRGHKDWDDVEI